VEGKQIAISYSYDELDRLSSVTYGDEKTVRYSYDEAGNLVTVGDFLNPREEGVPPSEAGNEKSSDSTSDESVEKISLPWHLSRGGESFGPYTWDEMLSFATDGRIQPEDLVWNSSMTEWAKARDVAGLMIQA